MKGKVALLAVLVAMGTAAGMRLAGVSLFGGEDPTSQEFLTKVASQVNKNMPMMVDSDTELMDTAGLPGVFVYNYRLVAVAAEQVDVDAFLGALRPSVSRAACSTPNTRQKLLDKGVVLRYTYADKDRHPITQFDVSVGDCES